MRCRYCGCAESRVVDTRPIEGGSVIRRRRECAKCGRRFTTYERVEAVPVVVVKRDGTLQAFDADKLRRGILKALEKRPVTPRQVDDMVESVEKAVRAMGREQIQSVAIGDMVLQELRGVDTVAYIRFASVYRSFQNVDEFMAELEKISEQDKEELNGHRPI